MGTTSQPPGHQTTPPPSNHCCLPSSPRRRHTVICRPPPCSAPMPHLLLSSSPVSHNQTPPHPNAGSKSQELPDSREIHCFQASRSGPLPGRPSSSQVWVWRALHLAGFPRLSSVEGQKVCRIWASAVVVFRQPPPQASCSQAPPVAVDAGEWRPSDPPRL
ncbi:hypothetical protein VPH35_129341 [Triticum aestivum]